jgi:hypothetical protein
MVRLGQDRTRSSRNADPHPRIGAGSGQGPVEYGGWGLGIKGRVHQLASDSQSPPTSEDNALKAGKGIGGLGSAVCTARRSASDGRHLCYSRATVGCGWLIADSGRGDKQGARRVWRPEQERRGRGSEKRGSGKPETAGSWQPAAGRRETGSRRDGETGTGIQSRGQRAAGRGETNSRGNGKRTQQLNNSRDSTDEEKRQRAAGRKQT